MTEMLLKFSINDVMKLFTDSRLIFTLICAIPFLIDQLGQ